MTNPYMQARTDLLTEANSLVNGDRNSTYGDPNQDFQRTADMWSGYLERPITPADVAWMMMMLKASRDKHQRKRDNWVDAAGYAACGWSTAYEPETEGKGNPEAEVETETEVDNDDLHAFQMGGLVDGDDYHILPVGTVVADVDSDYMVRVKGGAWLELDGSGKRWHPDTLGNMRTIIHLP